MYTIFAAPQPNTSPSASVPPNASGLTPHASLHNFFVTHEKLHTDTREGLEALRWWVRKTDAKLIVIDPLYAASTAESLSDGRSARNALSGLKDICRDERCAAVVLHHFTKDSSAGLTRERIADSSQILAVASMDLLFSSQSQQDGSRRIWLRGQGRGDFTNQTWLIESKGVTDFQLLAQGTLPEVQSYANEDAILTPLRESTEPLTAEQIAKALNQNVRSLRNRLPKLIEQGRIEKAGQDGNTILYALTEQAPEQ